MDLPEDSIVLSKNKNTKPFMSEILSSMDENNNPLQQRHLNESIKDFYQNSIIFITGATGFLGKAITEKLLRSCYGIETIYILIRPKRGLTSIERFQDYIKHHVFDRLRSEKSSALEKLHPLSGDVTQPRLGLRNSDYQLLIEKVNIVFHSAATVKFNESLSDAAKLNAKGTQRLLELCTKMLKLKSVVHVSTAYSNPGRKYVGEMLYPKVSPMEKDTFIRCVDMLPDNFLNDISEQLQGSHPNTYTLTKAIAEQIVYEHADKFPICIIRPSIVTAAIEEPYPGWVDNIQGITGIMMEIGRGTITSILGDKNCICDIIPVDVVVNSMIGAAWITAQTREFCVYNCTSGQLRPITWETLGFYTQKWARINPSKYVALYPNFSYRKNHKIHKIYEISMQLLPAYIFDVLLKFQGGKPIMLKIARKIIVACHTGKFFALHEWIFDVENQKRLVDMIATDKNGNEFLCGIENLDYDDYIRNYMLGIRKYVLKDGDESLEKARRKLSRLYWLKISFQIFILILVLSSTFKCFFY